MAKKTELGSNISEEITFGSMPEVDKNFVIDALNKGATRRQAMGWLVAMGATVSSAGAIIGMAEKAIAETPKKGGTLRLAGDQHGPGDTLDPPGYTKTIDYIRGRMHFSSLTRLQPNLTVAPEVATEWVPNADATEWTFVLRKDVTFHDGSKLTADDVIFSMNKHIGEDSTSAAKGLVANITEWKKLDDYAVRAVLSSPNAELPVLLATFHFKIVKNGTTDFSNPVGSGPFRLKEFEPGVRSVHTRFDDYWAGPAHIDELELFAITDPVARLNALINGDVHLMTNLDPKAIGQIENADGVEVYSINSGSYMGVVGRYDNSPAGANHMELLSGLKHLMRRDRILQVVQKGIGDIGNDQPVGPAFGASWCKEANDPVAHPYDPDRAKFHLQKTGLSGLELNVAEVAPGLTDIALFLQRECAKVGFNLQVKKVPNDGYWGAIWNKAPFHVTAWNMRPSSNIIMTLAYHSKAKWNESAWGNDRFDQLLDMHRAETDPAKRYEMDCEMQTIASKEAGTMIATHRAFIDGKSTKVKGLGTLPTLALGGGEWGENVWIDA